MTAIAACALPDTENFPARPMQMLADLASCAMRMARLAVEQYEALTTQAPPQPEAGKPRRQPDPGTLFTRAARVVLDCITKEYRLATGLPLAPLPRLPNIPRVECLAPETFRRDASAAEPVRQALRTVTRNHPHGEKLLHEGLEHLEAALAAAPSKPIEIPDLFLHVCAAAGIRLEAGQLRKLTRDPVFATLPAKPPVPS